MVKVGEPFQGKSEERGRNLKEVEAKMIHRKSGDHVQFPKSIRSKTRRRS